MRLKRLLAGLARVWRREIARLQPSAPFAGCYLRPGLAPAPRLHRSLWWHSRNRLPRLCWLPLEAIRILHWRVLGHRQAVATAVSVTGAQVAKEEGIPLAIQRERIGRWAKDWCIRPEQAYAFRLYREDADGLSHIHGTEQMAYHRLMNAECGADKADYRLIQDKLRLAERLADVGVPVVASLRCSRGDDSDLAAMLSGGTPVFCKSRFGSRGEGAFHAVMGLPGPQGRMLSGRVLPDAAAVRAAWRALAQRGAILVQPYLQNHPALQALAPESNAISLRVITRAGANGAQVWVALLYVQAAGQSDAREYWLLSVDTVTGRLADPFGHWADTPQDLVARDGQLLPFWQDVAAHSLRAHRELPGFWAIAWDWIIAPDGPVLLEGNAGWDLSPLQELGTDFVRLALLESV